MIIAGIDEAGYGPLLGPLVVSATAFEIPAPAGELTTDIDALPCIWRLLKGAVTAKKSGSGARLLIADSKIVHNLADGNRHLERGVIAFATTAGMMAPGDTLSLFIHALGCSNHGLQDHAWYANADPPFPRWAQPGDLAIAGNMLAAALQKSGVRIRAMRAAVISERRFNALIHGTRNKASALVSITLEHLHFLHAAFGASGLIVGVDKQGGRDNYTRLLLDAFPDSRLKVLNEGPQSSSYVLSESGATPRLTVIHFREKSEQHFLPTALASMTCKYLRESLMAQFNAWWCDKVQNLRPTAGYYLDGMRWLADVQPHLSRLNIRREELVRVR